MGALEAVEELKRVAQDEKARTVEQGQDMMQEVEEDRGKVLRFIDDGETEAGEGGSGLCTGSGPADEVFISGEAGAAEVVMGKAVYGANVDEGAHDFGYEVVALHEHVLLKALVVGEENDVAGRWYGRGGDPLDGGGECGARLAGSRDSVHNGVAGPGDYGVDDVRLLGGEVEIGHGGRFGGGEDVTTLI